MELFRRYACYGCHAVAGYEKLPRPGPPLAKTGEKINYSYLVKWIKSPRSIVADARMPDFGFTDQQARNIADYLVNFTRKERIDVTAGQFDPHDVESGKELYKTSRCSICHRIDDKGGVNRQVYAPDLTVEGTKIQSAEWIADRIGDPAKYYPDTVMPRFRLTLAERRQIAAYMGSELVDVDLEQHKSQLAERLDAASILKGRELIDKYGCAGCHAVPGFDRETKVGPELTQIGSIPLEHFEFAGLGIERERSAWLLAKIKTPRKAGRELKMPDYHVDPQEGEALTTYLLGLRGEEFPRKYMPPSRSEGFVPAGPAGVLIQDLKCLTCHSIRGTGGKFAPDLSFEGAVVEEEWLKRFLKAPDLIRPLLEQMPKFNISDEEASTLANYIKTALRDPRIPEGPSGGDIVAGKELYDRSGCRGCHQLKSGGGAVGPNLTGVGKRLSAPYLFARTKDAHVFQPAIVEPRYRFNDQQAAALAAYLKTLDTNEAAQK